MKQVQQMNRVQFNEAEALLRLGGDESLLSELVGLFIYDFNIRFKELTRAILTRDFETIRFQGHGVKGAARNLSLTGIAEAARRIEAAGEATDIGRARSALEELKAQYHLFTDVYYRERAGLKMID